MAKHNINHKEIAKRIALGVLRAECDFSKFGNDSVRWNDDDVAEISAHYESIIKRIRAEGYNH